ncbi:MAG: hypothetical protein WC769_00015 [Thermodesulfovibrionales bacterium]|jgi:hypothetical protein
MSKKSLKQTNPYLKDPELRAFLIERCVASSTAIEGVYIKYPKLTNEIKKKMQEIAAAQQSHDKSR